MITRGVKFAGFLRDFNDLHALRGAGKHVPPTVVLGYTVP
jgi:hypothetical protein